MSTKNCSVAQGGEPESCTRGCREFGCCVITQGGEIPHLCLSQLLKRLGRDASETDKCGTCETKLKEINDSRGSVAPDSGLS
jgi:hypothetical protein